MPKHRADSSRHGYGVSKRKTDYLFRMPKVAGGDFQKAFKTIEAGKSWQTTMAKIEWGLERFSLIKRGRLCVLRSSGCGVSVRKTKSTMTLANGHITEYWQFGVFWYDHRGAPKSKMFSRKRYGDNAELEANWFAAKQRAILTGSELNLPSHFNINSFDTHTTG